MTPGQSEAFSRVLIDKTLEASGWDLLDSQQVRFEINTAGGRAARRNVERKLYD